ncbi:pyridoxal-phosphate dependent enzyme (plasmid) [Streptomyces sp. NBC_01591]|uniref:pyridoxal-phosphate dependent enzyme n=1 Tax=Streptomyces sp. NBC_01591 TaxID=2975888 RepID=UPI002DD878E2|nr:pyridoxal-phosphate dependent enzyme [Streptomyces sp. NBC_01591]WSD73894.1 pyridoxal-phosphate dependent enzyme [Streptomyces sp. NBC_01591]
MLDHIADAMKEPDVVRLDRNVHVLRFEMMKLHSALEAVRRLLADGVVKPGDTLMDSSSGTYGHSLALACHKYGMKCRIVCSTKLDDTMRRQFEMLGARVDQVEIPAGPLVDKMDQRARLDRVAEILDTEDDVHWMQQYHDDVHYLGYRACADLLLKEFGGAPLTLVGGVGTGASTGGLTSYLREMGADVTLVGVQPFESVTFGSEPVEDPVASISGIGSPIVMRNVRYELYDRVHWIGYESAVAATTALLRRHAVYAGMSSGCNYLAATWEAAHAPERPCVFIAADTGHRYAENVYGRPQGDESIESLTPRRIDALDQLAFPWSVMDWKRRDFQPLGAVRPRTDRHKKYVASVPGAAPAPSRSKEVLL